MKNTLQKSSISFLCGAAICLVALVNVVQAATTNTSISSLITPSDLEQNTTIEQRVAERKAAYKIQITPAEEDKLVAKCAVAQTSITGTRSKDAKAAAIRLQAYNDLAKRLNELVNNLSAQGVDATQLLNIQTKLMSDINNYLTDASKYKAAMDDLNNVDCQSDPAGFKATLTEARAERSRMADEVKLVKQNLPALKSALSAERQLLIKKESKS